MGMSEDVGVYVWYMCAGVCTCVHVCVSVCAYLYMCVSVCACVCHAWMCLVCVPMCDCMLVLSPGASAWILIKPPERFRKILSTRREPGGLGEGSLSSALLVTPRVCRAEQTPRGLSLKGKSDGAL